MSKRSSRNIVGFSLAVLAMVFLFTFKSFVFVIISIFLNLLAAVILIYGILKEEKKKEPVHVVSK